MSNAAVDRNVLFSLWAWQLGLVERDVLATTMETWMTGRSGSLSDLLVSTGRLSAEDGRWLDQAVDRQLGKFGPDAVKMLAGSGSVMSLCNDLRRISFGESAQANDSERQPDSEPIYESAEINATAQTIDEPAPSADFHLPTMVHDATLAEPISTDTSLLQVKPAMERFRIVRPHARGGLGEVFVAVDGELKREVALKQILSRHVDNGASRTRFMLEAEVTGQLEHPGVVPVYGLGSQADGRPYYAMRFIRGESLEDAIAKFHAADDDGLRTPGQRALELRNLLTRFVAVCNTIEYAHSRGFVHRDIKPENIMLGPYGETLVVDWGLARPMEGAAEETHADDLGATQSDSGSTARPTQMGSIVGTPQFMSPEQADGRLDLIRGTSDVYSLGATLYSLLTDQPAFVASDVRKVLRDVREGRFPSPRQVRRSVPRGLDAICMRAMALNPADRYPSARALADDLEHWLADEPVSALRETQLERVQRWMRRHRTWTRAGAAALAIVAAVAGVAYVREAGLRGEVQRAFQAETTARREADAARGLADRNAALAQQERARAEAHAEHAEQQSVLALGTLKSVLFDIQAKLKNVPAAHSVRLSMLNTVIEGLKQVARNLDTAAETDHSLVRAHLDLGDIFLQVGTLEAAGATIEAEKQYLRGVEAATQLSAGSPESAVGRADLAAAYQRMGDVSMQRGALASAADWLRKSYELRRVLADERKDDVQSQRDYAASLQRLGLVSEHLRDLEAATNYYKQFFELSRAIVAGDPKNVEDRRNLSVSYERMGDISLLQQDVAAAEDFFRQSLAVRRELAASQENKSLAERDMSVTLDRLGTLALDRNDVPAASDFFRQSLVLRQSLFDADPNNLQTQRDLLVSYALLGDAALREDNLEQSVKYYQRYAGIAQRLVVGDPANVQFQRDLATAFERQGYVMLRGGNAPAAQELYHRHYEMLKPMATSETAVARTRSDFAQTCATLGNLSLQLGDVVAGRGYFEESLAHTRQNAEAKDVGSTETRELLEALLRNGDLHLRIAELGSARSLFDEALQLAEKVDATSSDRASRSYRANVEALLAQLSMELRDPENAMRWSKAALERMQAVQAGDPAEMRSQTEPWLEEQRALQAFCTAAEKAIADGDLAEGDDPAAVGELLEFIAVARVRAGKFDDAEKTIEQLVKIEPKSAQNLFAAARRYAAAVQTLDADPQNKTSLDRRKEWLARSVQLLQEADQVGAFADVVNAARLEFATDFASLKDRKEYVELVNRVRSRRVEKSTDRTS